MIAAPVACGRIVGINEGILSTNSAPGGTPTLPSPASGGGEGGGGMKEGGIGREGSKYGIKEFLEVKYLCMGGIDR